MSKPVEIEFLMRDRLTPGLDKAGKAVDGLTGKSTAANAELEAARKQAQDLRNVIALLEAQMEELRMAGQNASPDLDQSRNIAHIEALQKQIKELEAQLKLLEEASENTHVVPPEMPQAKQQFNGLHNSIQQMAREMPSLAMGPQMFFLAISNNLPIFADEVSRARKEYDELVKSGKKGTPVWKQILSSLFSWQTALTTGIMLLVMYGDEIIEWTKSLFSAKKGVDEFNISLAEMAEIEKNGRAEMVRTRFEIDTVIASLKNFTGSKEQEKAKVEELNRKYGEAFGYYDTIAQWYDILKQKSADYIQMLFLQAKAQAMVSKAVEADEEINKIKSQSPDEADSAMGFFGKMGQYMIQSSMAEAGQFYDAQAAIEKHNKDAYETLLKEAEGKRDGYLEEAKKLTEEAANVGKTSGIGGYVKPKEPKGNVTPEQEREKRLEAERRLSEEMQSLRRKNQQDDISLQEDGTRKRLEQINFDYETRKAEIARKAKELEELNKSSGQSPELTKEQQGEIDKANALNLQERQKATAEVYKSEFDAMRDHLKEYGTFQQQKLAITEEYAEKIRNATGEGERLSLAVECDSRLAGVEAQELRANIDWSTVFGEFGGMFHDVIAPELEKLKAYTQTDEFKNADHESQEALISAIRQMEQSLGGADKVSFRKLGADIAAYRKNLADLDDAQVRYGESYAELMAAQQRYIQAMQSGTEEEQGIAKTALETAQANADAAAENVQTMQMVANESQRTMSDTAQTLKSSMDGVVSGLQQIASGSLSGAYEGLITLGNSAEKIGGRLGEAFGKVADTLEDVPIIGWIVSIIDIFKDGASVAVGGLLDAVFDAVSGILSDVLSGDLFVTVGKSILNGVSGIFDAITFGGFSSWIDTSNAKEVQETIDRLTDRNESLQTAIEDLTDEIKSGRGTKSVSAYRDAYKYQQETNDNYLQMAQAQAGYHGSHHSWNYYWGGFSQEQIDKLSSQIGRQWNGDIWNLTPEEMKLLRSNVDMWSQIQNTGKGGYGGRLTDKLDDYIDQAGKLEELTNQLYEGLTGISFDSMYSSFIDQLMDMEASAEDFADNVSEYFMRAMLSNKIGELYADKLEEWWKEFGQAMEDNDLTEAERHALQEEYMKYVEEAMKLRDQLAEATGYDKTDEGGTSQSGKPGGFNAMTQDQGTKLEGMFTSGLQHWSSIDEKVENVIDKMNTAEGHLARIEENTGKSAGHLGEIKEEIRKIIRDGLKMK